MKKVFGFIAMIAAFLIIPAMAFGQIVSPEINDSPSWAKILAIVVPILAGLFGGMKWFQKLKKAVADRKDELLKVGTEVTEFRKEFKEFTDALKVVGDKINKGEQPTAEEYAAVYIEGKDLPGALDELWDAIKGVVHPSD